MAGSDIAVIETQSGQISDRFATSNSYPDLDTDAEGENDLSNISKFEDGEFTIFTWTRNLVTDDKLDLELKADSQFTVITARGDIINEDIAQHRDGHISSDTITFTYDSKEYAIGNTQDQSEDQASNVTTKSGLDGQNGENSAKFLGVFGLI